ncbi:cystathionine beta-lyase [Thorsellia anophelis]|uniref:Cystathionine beta-lyase n=1 Tax=Thorsellia anophelis DSM 18579 TaxID=1123402 RepID=A0A1I0E933_9GAMM|nr:cystathionine beta-lyase [Thorsellia anophelis]SET41559.1 cystathionine beta-lyase [Thorsellia anophelis DSM 18579]
MANPNDKANFTQETGLIHTGRDPRYTLQTVNPIVQRGSSIIFDSLAQKQFAGQNKHKTELFYGRRGTLTHFALKEALCELEGGAGCALFPSGAAAISQSILAFVKTGDHVLMTGSAYEPSQDFCHHILTKFGVETTFFEASISHKIIDYIKPNTKVLFLESPGSITMEVQDIPTIVQLARAKNPEIIIMIDNTWAAGYLFKALSFGIDISIQSGTKYLIGHSDYMLGTAVSNERCWDQLREQAYTLGQTVDADTAYMASRGLRTLATRLKQHEASSLQVANWLNSHPLVDKVFHPALASCPGHEFFKRDFQGSCGLFSFTLNHNLSEEQIAHMIEPAKLFKMAFSWGGFESLILAIEPNALKSMRPKNSVDITTTLIRLHIGLESPEDLIHDLGNMLKRIENYL